MRDLRDETRARHEEIARRFEHAHRQLEEKLPQGFDDRLRHLVRSRGELFNRYYGQMIAYLGEQEPNYVNVRQTLAEINRLLDETALPMGHRDRWWNPRSWLKRALSPIRRFVLRRQNEVNALMRDTLFYLFNHSSHIETQRIELEMGVQMIQAMNILLEQVEMSRRYMQEWLRVALTPIADYIAELQRHAAERQTEAIASVQENMTRRLEKFAGDWEIRLGEVTRGAAGVPVSKFAALVGFDNLKFAQSLRSRTEEVRRQQKHYVEYLRGHSEILDAGCGRGEFLELLRESQISAYGVDSDENMVAYCREKGLTVQCADILEYLAQLPDQSLGGLVALQLIEHFDFPSLFQLFRLAGRKIRPLGILILETVNPSCLTTFSGAFYADPTHQRPIHPEAARRMAEMVGFAEVGIDYLNPVKDGDKLKLLTGEDISDPVIRRIVDLVNADILLLNSVLYNYADYAVIGRKAP